MIAGLGAALHPGHDAAGLAGCGVVGQLDEQARRNRAGGKLRFDGESRGGVAAAKTHAWRRNPISVFGPSGTG